MNYARDCFCVNKNAIKKTFFFSFNLHRSCPTNYTCLPDVGENPNWGYTNFDHFGWSMLNSLQLITLDFWEDPYNKVIHANGPWNIVFFIFVVFFGSFYLVNLMLAVVSMAYEEEAKNAGKVCLTLFFPSLICSQTQSSLYK